MDLLLPLPDADGIAQTKELYRKRFGTTLTDEQAADVLGRVMRFLYLTAELERRATTAPNRQSIAEHDRYDLRPVETNAES